MTRRLAIAATYTTLALALAAGFVFGQPLLSVLPWQLTLATVCALVAAVMLGHYLRTGATIDKGIAEINAGIDVDRHCAAHGHSYKAITAPTVWRCSNCGDRVKSLGGWVGGAAS